MHLLKSRANKALLLVAASLMLSFVVVKPVAARDNDPKATPNTQITTGIASWYHDKFVGRKTATGEIFSQEKMTCASNKYPLGTWLLVTNMKNGKSVLVRVNDRMSPKIKRSVDLTRSAAKKLGIEKAGLGKVTIQSFGDEKPTVS